MTLQEIKSETSTDVELQTLISTVENGWPYRISQTHPALKKYWNVRSEISVIDGIVLKNDKYVIPVTLRDRLIDYNAHEGHMGNSKCKARLRQYYWWPNLNESVESKIRACICCCEP